MSIVYRVRKTDAPTPWFAVEWRPSGTSTWHVMDHYRDETEARIHARTSARETRGRLESKTKRRNGTTIIVVGSGKRRNPQPRDKRGRFVKRRGR